MRVERMGARYEPNDGHRALAELERPCVLDAVITQNVDGLHLEAGNITVLELHGHARTVRCRECGDEQPFATVLARVGAVGSAFTIASAAPARAAASRSPQRLPERLP